MASKFAITAELNLQTKNLSQVVNNLKQQFQGMNLNIKIKDLATAESQIRGIGKAADGASKSVSSLGNNIAQAAKRFSAITLATGTFVGLTRAIKHAVSDAIEFEREMVKIAQATGKTVGQLRGLEVEIGNIATGLGASSKELIVAARNLTQAGFAADKVTGSLKVLAQTDLAATFKSIEDTTEGAIAILNQFGREAQRTGSEVAFLEKSLSAINQVSKDFAVESSDLITAVKTTGSAFESAGGSLNELIALFTSVRSTTRESAESIATGFRTIFTRVQRVDTMNNLRDLGIELQDIKGQFVGPMEAAKRLSIALSTIDPKDFRFNLIVEQLGGFRQVSKVIPLIQQFAVAQKALGVAQNSSGSLARDAATAQQSLAVQIQKTREEFLRFVKELTQSSAFQDTVSKLLQMANAFIQVGTTLKPLLPLIASFGALKIGQSLLPGIKSLGIGKKAQGGRIGFATGGLVPGSGNSDTVPAMLTPGEFVIKKSSVKKLGIGNLARVNKYAAGGKIEDQNEIGAAILEPGVRDSGGTHQISNETKKYLEKNNQPLFEKVKNKKWKIEKEGVSTKTYGKFRDAIENGLARGLEAAIAKSEDFTGISPIKLTAQNERNFLDTINEGSYGNMFEQILTFAEGKGEFDPKSDPKRPFDFTKGLPTLLSGDFPNLKMPFVDAKASRAAAAAVGDKIDRELLYDPMSYKGGRYQEEAYQSALGKEFKAGEKAKQQAVEKSTREQSADFRQKMIKALGDKTGKPVIAGLSLNNPGDATRLVNGITGSSDFGVAKFNLDRSQQAKVLKTIKQWKTNPPQTLAFASGGSVGTDTVPAMLTPGEYVINKKSAQAIGYASLNRMNKVGKFANGGFVQHFANGGTPTGQFSAFAKHAPKDPNFVSSSSLAQSAQSLKAPLASATEAAAKFKAELDAIVEKGNTLNTGLVTLGAAVVGVASQMSQFDKEFADMATAFSGTFATINGIGQNLKNMGFAQIAAMKSEREHRAAVEADRKALEQHTGTVSNESDKGDNEPSKFGKRLSLASKAAEGSIMGYALAQAVFAAKIAKTNAQAEKAGENLSRAMEKFATSANNEVEVRNGMIQTLLLSEKAQADYNASSSTQATVGGAAGGGIGAIIGGALGSLAGPAGTAIGIQLGSSIGSFAGTFFGTQLAKVFDESKIQAAAQGISGAFTTASKGIVDANKYFEKIDNKDLNDVNQQFSKMTTELAKAQGELSSFDPNILKTGSETMKAQFNKAADAVRNFENVVTRLSGIKLQKLTTVMSDMAKLGQNFDIGPAIKAQQEEIAKIVNAKYNPDIARATKAGNNKLAQGLTTQRDQEIAQGTREFEKSLLEAKLQIMETEKTLLKERAAREAIIGTLIEEQALKTTLQNFKFSIQQATKTSGELDAAFSDSVAGLKSSIPDASVFDLDMPDAADLQPALDALKTIGPIGENLATNLLDLNKVIPNLEVGLQSIAKAQATGGGKEIDKLIADTVEQGFGVSLGSAVGKRLSEIIKDKITGKGGNVENANPSILSQNTRDSITKEFTDYAEAIKKMSKETLQAWSEAEQEQLKILDKINQSENRKLDLTNQGVDSYGRMVEAISKAYSKNVPLAVKNMQRFAKQFNSIGKTAYTSVQSIGKNLRDAKGQLAGGVKDPLEAGKIQNTANRLEQSLKTLANQSERTGDTLAELEKFKAQREAYTGAATGYAFGSDEQRKSKDDAAIALQEVMAAGGDLDAISSDMRGQVDSLLSELGDAGKNIKKQLTANFFAKRGNMDMANMVMAETSTPEQKLIAELQNIYQEEIAAQKELKDLEIMYGEGQIKALNQVTDKIKGFNDQLRGNVQRGQDKSKAMQKAAGVTSSKLTTKEIDDIISSTKTSLEAVNKNIELFGEYISKLNNYLSFIKDPEAFKKTGAAVPVNPGAPPAAKRAKGGIIYRADGGFTPQGTDTVPAMLTPGEYVIRKSAVDSIGTDTLDAINNGYATGGLVSYLRRGGRAINYGRSANAKRQKAIANADRRKAQKAADIAEFSAPIPARSGPYYTLPGGGYGLGQMPQQPTGGIANGLLNIGVDIAKSQKPVVNKENQRQIDIDANLKRASAAAAVKEIEAGPEGANAPDFNDSWSASLGKWFNRNIYDRNMMTGSIGGTIANRFGYDAGPSLQFRSGTAKDIHRQNVLDKYDLQERNLPEKYRQKEKGPDFSDSIAKKGFFGTIFATEERKATSSEIANNRKKKEEQAKKLASTSNRQISDLSKEEAAKILGRMTGMATGGLVEYHARGGRAGARARAAQRRAANPMSDFARIENTRMDLGGNPLNRDAINSPQNFAQARNARTRQSAMRGTPGALSEMADMGQTIAITTDAEKIRAKYKADAANITDPDEYRKKIAEGNIAARAATAASNKKYDSMRAANAKADSMLKSPGKGYTWNPSSRTWTAPEKNAQQLLAKYPTREQLAAKKKAEEDSLFSRKPSANDASRYTNRKYQQSNAPLTAVEKIMQQAKPGWRSASFSSGGAVHLARGGRVGHHSSGGKIRRYQEGGSVDPYAEGGNNGQAPQMPDMTSFAKSIESLNAFVGSFNGFTATMSALAGQLSSVTVTHNVTFGGQVNVGGVSGEGIVNAMKSTIEGWIRDQVSKHPDVQKAVKASDQTRGG